MAKLLRFPSNCSRINRFNRKDNSRLLDAILKAFDDPEWGVELSPAIDNEQLERLKSIVDHRGYSRTLWNEPAKFRQALIRKIFVPPFISTPESDPKQGDIPYDYYTSFEVNKKSHSEEIAKLREQLLGFAYGQLELSLKTESSSIRSQLFTEIDRTICRLKSLEVGRSQRLYPAHEDLLLPIYHGYDLNHWIVATSAAKTETDLLAAVNGIVALQLKSKNPAKLLFDVIPLFRDVSFDDVTDISLNDETSLAAAALSLGRRNISYDYSTNRRTRRMTIEFPMRKALLENLSDFDDRDVPCLQAIIHRNDLCRGAENWRELVEFSETHIDSSDAVVRRRAYLLSLSMSGISDSKRFKQRGRFIERLDESINDLDPQACIAFIANIPSMNQYTSFRLQLALMEAGSMTIHQLRSRRQ